MKKWIEKCSEKQETGFLAQRTVYYICITVILYTIAFKDKRLMAPLPNIRIILFFQWAKHKQQNKLEFYELINVLYTYSTRAGCVKVSVWYDMMINRY